MGKITGGLILSWLKSLPGRVIRRVDRIVGRLLGGLLRKLPKRIHSDDLTALTIAPRRTLVPSQERVGEKKEKEGVSMRQDIDKDTVPPIADTPQQEVEGASPPQTKKERGWLRQQARNVYAVYLRTMRPAHRWVRINSGNVYKVTLLAFFLTVFGIWANRASREAWVWATNASSNAWSSVTGFFASIFDAWNIWWFVGLLGLLFILTFFKSRMGVLRYGLIVITLGIVTHTFWNKEGDEADQTAQEEVDPRPEVVARAATSLGNTPLQLSDFRSLNNTMDVLHVIADCESGDRTEDGGWIKDTRRQYNADGSLRTNTNNTNGTVDRGMWMINSVHDTEVRERNIDITTQAGNESFALILFARNELSDWDASRDCWEPVIRNMIGGGTPEVRMAERRSRLTPSDTTITVVARREWSETIVLPRGMKVDWMPEDAVTYELLAADSSVTTFPAVTQAPITVSGPLNRMAFRAIDADSVVITVVAYAP